jgi:uncharacterized protein YecE (DUF72 family)
VIRNREAAAIPLLHRPIQASFLSGIEEKTEAETMTSSDIALGRIHIGTSGWHYAHWRGPFYPDNFPPAKMLRWYAERFDTVEINNSFYQLPTAAALAAWCRETPANFCFALKASRYITHNRKLKYPKETVRKFMSQAARLKRRLGPILFQLPPSWKVNVERLEEFVGSLPRRRRYAFEFRNPTWNTSPVYETLRRHNAAFCIFELAGFRSPLEVTADFAYVRLHGPGNAYQGDYSGRHLRMWAKRIETWRKNLRHVFVYFDNDQAGFAAKNALALRRMLSQKRH